MEMMKNFVIITVLMVIMSKRERKVKQGHINVLKIVELILFMKMIKNV